MVFTISTFSAARASRPLAATGLMLAALSLAACGSSDPNSPGATPATTSQSGVVIADGAIVGATVCLDLDKNGRCDTGEPASSPTDAQGHYAITGVTQAQIDASPLVATLPATAVDAAHPGVAIGAAYALSAPAGAGAVISPVTRLVQAGVDQGLTRSAAESAVAAQLHVDATSLYDDYASASGTTDAALRQLAPTLAAQLQQGAPVSIGADTNTPTSAGYWVRSLTYADAGNYSLRYFSFDGTHDGSGLSTYHDKRTQEAAGQAVGFAYDTVTATASGWVSYDDTTPGTDTAGSPGVASLDGYDEVDTRTVVDVSGKTLAEVVAMAQDPVANTQSTLVGVDGSSLSTTLPAGSKVLRITASGTSTPVAYSPSDGSVGGASTLADVVTMFPALFPDQAVQAGVASGSNTLAMGNLHGADACGGGAAVCSQERLRAAFGPGLATTYYLCDLTVATDASANCQAAGAGTYALVTAIDGVTPLLTFAGLPAAASVQTSTRVMVQRNGAVYYGQQDKPTVQTTTRLNDVAFQALAAVLGIPAPAVTTTTPTNHPSAGTWNASFGGVDSGTCNAMTIDAQGNLSGTCTSTAQGGSFDVSGTVSATGSTTFSATGAADGGAVFSGNFGSGTGSGSWSWPQVGSGTWSATRQ